MRLNPFDNPGPEYYVLMAVFFALATAIELSGRYTPRYGSRSFWRKYAIIWLCLSLLAVAKAYSMISERL